MKPNKKVVLMAMLFYIFMTVKPGFSENITDERKTYLSRMNRIMIEVEVAVRNFNMKFLTAEGVAEIISENIKKFEALKTPSMFSIDHNNMLSSFKSMRDGFKRFRRDQKTSVTLVKSGAGLFKQSALNMKRIAEENNLIPLKPGSKKTILPPQAAAVTVGPVPTLSPHVASPDIKAESLAIKSKGSPDIDLKASLDTVTLSKVPSNSATITGKVVSIVPQDDYFILNIKTDLNDMIEMDLIPGACNILKANKIVGINSLTKGLDAYIIYTQDDDKRNASFINILNPTK